MLQTATYKECLLPEFFEFITKNLPELVKYTDVNSTVIVNLLSTRVFDASVIEEIVRSFKVFSRKNSKLTFVTAAYMLCLINVQEATTTSTKKAFYKHVSKCSSEQIPKILDALTKGLQTRAVEIL